MVFTFPIRTRISADVKIDLSSLKLKDILRNSVRFKASQTLGMLRMNGRQLKLGYDSIPDRNTAGFTAGIMGLSLTRKYRVLFWSVVANISEEDKTIAQMIPRASALLGQCHIRGIRRNYFYGVSLTYSDAYIIPIPFFGGSEPIGEKFVFNYTLPAQINVQYRKDKKLLITAGVNMDGFRTGLRYGNGRVNLNYAAAMGYGSVRYKFSKNLMARVEGGYKFYQRLHYTNTDLHPQFYSLSSGPYVQCGFSLLFGRSVWEKIMDNLNFDVK